MFSKIDRAILNMTHSYESDRLFAYVFVLMFIEGVTGVVITLF